MSVQKKSRQKFLCKNKHQSGIALYNYTACNETLYLFAFVWNFESQPEPC